MMDYLPITLYVLAALGYGLFALLLLIRSDRRTLSLIMALAATATAAWAGLNLAGRYDYAPVQLVYLAGVLKDGAWLAVILTMMDRPAGVWRLLAGLTAALVLFHAGLATSAFNPGSLFGIPLDAEFSGLLVTLMGLVLVENLARNSSRDKFWAIKHLVIGLSAILTFQFFIQIADFVTHQANAILLVIAPFFWLLALPLFAVTAIRSPNLQLQVHSSRRVIFQTTALVIAGIALQGTAISAYWLQNYGGGIGTVLAILFVFTAFVGVAALGASSGLRSRLRLFINENFFNYRYDYRAEWTKFIRALSSVEETGTPLKVLRTFADLMECPGGALWVWKDNSRQFLPVAQWSSRATLKPLAADDNLLAGFEDENSILIDLTAANLPATAAGWKAMFPDHWLIVPLRYRARLAGIILLCKPRSRRDLNWEDYNLVALVAMQLAVYLVHDETSEALHDARQMEEFNKRFAFLIHDMKNTIGQLDLLARNAERFGENPEFRKDMHITLRNSVDKLNSLLVQIRGGDPKSDNLAAAGNKHVNVAELVRAFVDEKQGLGLPVTVQDEVSPACATIADDHTLINVLEHVVANAIEVTPADADVKVQMSIQRGAVRIAVDDQGPGMSEEFINERLFRPFRSTKAAGFGIGAYQARETVRKLGGNFEVFSTEGQGTSIVISLPCRITQTASVN
jgi:putative PEP-CTERM system histidine kinase